MARRATAVKEQRADSPDLLLLDSGNTLMGQTVANRTEGRNVVAAMNLLGYDAMTAGRFDFFTGREALLARAKDARFAVLSANLVALNGGKPILPQHVIVERTGHKIALVGLAGPTDVAETSGQHSGAKVNDPRQAAREVVEKLRGQVDAIVVLSRLGQEEDLKLAGSVPGIGVIIGALTYEPSSKPVVDPVNGTILVYPGSQGENLGRLKVEIGAGGRATVQSWQAIRLDETYADDSEMLAVLAREAKAQ